MAEKTSVATLIEDYAFYPREKIVEQNVMDIMRVYETGKELPPVIVDRQTNRIIDGFHRVRATKKLFGPDAEIDVVYEEHDDSSFFLRSIETNVGHGQKLSSYDKVRCIVSAEQLGITRTVLAHTLGMTLKRLEGLVTRKTASDGEVVKRTVGHLSGRDMTPAQKQYNKKAGGMNQTFYINQLIGLIESDSIDWENVNVSEGMSRLSELIKDLY